MHRRPFVIMVIALSATLPTVGVQADPLISAAWTAKDVTDFSSTGINLGKTGYWFPNFNASSPTGLSPVDQNLKAALPSWLLVDYNPNSPTYSFSYNDPSYAYSAGGNAGNNAFKLPGGTVGLSGQLVDDMNVTNTQSNQIVRGFAFGPGAPSSLLLTIVLDNAPLTALTSVSRLKITHASADASKLPTAQYDSLFSGTSKDGMADVYVFKLDNIEVGGGFQIQLRSPGNPAGADTGLGGILLDPVPVVGDANNDLKVTGADYTLWAANYGRGLTNATVAQGDFNGDGKVTGADYTLWAANFQSFPVAAAAAVVPEPSALALALAGLSLIAAAHGRRRIQR